MIIDTLQHIVINTSAQVAENQVTVTLSSSFYAPTLEVFSDQYYLKTNSNSVEIHPKMEWVPSTTISVEVEGGTHTFTTKEDFYYYLPEQVAYSKNFIIQQDPWDELLKLGLATTEEKDLLETLPTGISNVGHKLSKCLVGAFLYNNTVENKAITLLKGLRRAMQLLVILELEVLVEYFLFTPGPSIEWFRKAAIPFSVSDEEVFTRLSEISVDIDKLEAKLISSEMNIAVIDSLKYHMSPDSDYYGLVRAITLYFMALRYYSNGEFSY